MHGSRGHPVLVRVVVEALGVRAHGGPWEELVDRVRSGGSQRVLVVALTIFVVSKPLVALGDASPVAVLKELSQIRVLPSGPRRCSNSDGVAGAFAKPPLLENGIEQRGDLVAAKVDPIAGLVKVHVVGLALLDSRTLGNRMQLR